MLEGLITALLVSQNLFAKTYGGTSTDYAWCMIQTADGGYAAAGVTDSFGAGANDVLVLKLTPNGSMSWSRTFGDTTWDGAVSIVQTSDGGFATAGTMRSSIVFPEGFSDFLLLKMNSSGSLTWARTFGGAGYEEALSMTQTSDGGYAVAGYTESFGAGYGDCLILKLASDGSLIWARTLGGTSSEYPNSIIQTSDGGLLAAGSTNSFGAGASDCLILKLASDGSLSWARTFGGTAVDAFRHIIQTSDGGFAVAGYTYSFGAGGPDFLVLKLTSDGSLSWAKTFGGAGNDQAHSINQTTDGGFAVAGYTYSFGAGGPDFLVLKLTSDGSLSWARTFGGTSYDYPYSINQTTDGGLVAAGSTMSFGTGGWDVLLLTMTAQGDYAGCVQACNPTATTPALSTSSPTTGLASCSPTQNSPTLTLTTPSLTTTNACLPLEIDESDIIPRPGITFSPVPGGALFLSPETLGIKIYSADGRLAYSGELRKGKNKIVLDQGVYLWQAGAYKGKAVVR
jgi:uncharacterized delta-60 repeat protein